MAENDDKEKKDAAPGAEQTNLFDRKEFPSVYAAVKHDDELSKSLDSKIEPALPTPPAPAVKTDAAAGQATPPEAPRDARADVAGHADGWTNLLTGLGLKGSDKRVSSVYYAEPRLTWSDLTYLYRSDGLAKRVVNLMTNDMFRAWFKIEGDPEGVIELKLKELDAKKQLKQAVRLARLFGGSIAILGINDGQTYEKPVKENSIKGVEHIHVFDRWRMTINTADLYLDPANEKYGMPERYLVTPLYGMPFYVHETRVLRFEGEPVTDIIRIQNQGWGDSVLQCVWDRLRALGESYGNLEHIIDEFIIGLMTINNLQDMIAGGKEKLVQKRLNMVDITKSVMNTVLLDDKETYSRISATTTGLGEVMDKIIESLSSVTGYPVCLLMGRSQAGLSNDETSQVRFYYDVVAAEQEEQLYPQLNRLINYINIGLGRPIEDEWFIRFNPLWQPTEKQIVEQRKTQSETDKNYIDAGVILPEEVAVSRFGGDFYSSDTNLSEEHKFLLGELDEEPEGVGEETGAPGEAEGKVKGAGEGAAAVVKTRRQQAHGYATREPAASRKAWSNKQQTGTMFGADPMRLSDNKARTTAKRQDQLSSAPANPSEIRRASFLMSPPFTLDVKSPNNALMLKLPPEKREVNLDRAIAQWETVYNFIAANSETYLLPAMGNFQDRAYVANVAALLPHLDNGTIVISKMQSPPRQGEEIAAHTFLKMLKMNTVDAPLNFEGEAELKWLGGNNYAAGYGERTDIKIHEWFKEKFGMNIISIGETDPECYHLDCSIYPIAPGRTLVVTPLLTRNEIAALEKVTGIIPCESIEFGHAGVTNCVRLKNNILFESPITEMKTNDPAYQNEKAMIDFLGRLCVENDCELKVFDMSELEKSGAALSCCVLHLNFADFV